MHSSSWDHDYDDEQEDKGDDEDKSLNPLLPVTQCYEWSGRSKRIMIMKSKIKDENLFLTLSSNSLMKAAMKSLSPSFLNRTMQYCKKAFCIWLLIPLGELLTCARHRTWVCQLWSWQPPQLPTPSAGCMRFSGPPSKQLQILKIDSRHIWQNMCLGSPSVLSASSRRGRGVPQVRCSPILSWHAPSPPGCQGGSSPYQNYKEWRWWCGWQGVMTFMKVGGGSPHGWTYTQHLWWWGVVTRLPTRKYNQCFPFLLSVCNNFTTWQQHIKRIRDLSFFLTWVLHNHREFIIFNWVPQIAKVIPRTTWSWLVLLTWVPQQRLASTPGIVTSRTWSW